MLAKKKTYLFPTNSVAYKEPSCEVEVAPTVSVDLHLKKIDSNQFLFNQIDGILRVKLLSGSSTKGLFLQSVRVDSRVDACKEYIGFNCTIHTECQH